MEVNCLLLTIFDTSRMLMNTISINANKLIEYNMQH